MNTLKEAKAAGLREADKWVSQGKYPRRDAEPFIIKGREFYAEDQCELLMSKTFFTREMGLAMRDGATPVCQRHTGRFGKSMWYDVYRKSDFSQ